MPRIALQFPDPGRTCDIDLGEEVSDHVDADEDQASLAEHGTEALTDVTFTGGEWPAFRCSSGRDVAPMIVWGRHPGQLGR